MARTTTVSKAKRGILDPKVEEKVLAAADPIMEWPAIWLMMKVGMHPENLVRLRVTNFEKDSQACWLQFKRAKNSKPRREMLPVAVYGRVFAYIARRDRPKTRQGYWDMARRVGEKAGLNGVSPMTLRHTACLNFLREFRNHPDRFKLIATKMGCSEDIVAQNYIDMEAWERIR